MLKCCISHRSKLKNLFHHILQDFTGFKRIRNPHIYFVHNLSFSYNWHRATVYRLIYVWHVWAFCLWWHNLLVSLCITCLLLVSGSANKKALKSQCVQPHRIRETLFIAFFLEIKNWDCLAALAPMVIPGSQYSNFTFVIFYCQIIFSARSANKDCCCCWYLLAVYLFFVFIKGISYDLDVWKRRSPV